MPERGTKEYVDACLSMTYLKSAADRWWDRPRVGLDGKTPAEAWDNGQAEAVTRLAEAISRLPTI